ncbi:pupal cuticle protein Edg-84A-like [Nymphalis io]|uniref:pupal cuticle protein Edg-84A-like n=1 Tax=Inachis io TaxID=171585 RepID=UPI0021694C75|nr:pupal cuticle protein Edg-84A-like [Nymphalis io]
MDFIVKVFLLVTMLYTNELGAAPRKPRLSLAAQNPSYYYSDVDGILGTYSFGYDVLDPETGNTQFRTEERYPNGTVVGSYGYIDSRGRSRRFDYIADEHGYRVSNEGAVNEKYVQIPADIRSTSTESSVSWSRPGRVNKKKPLKIPSNVLEAPRFT